MVAGMKLPLVLYRDDGAKFQLCSDAKYRLIWSDGSRASFGHDYEVLMSHGVFFPSIEKALANGEKRRTEENVGMRWNGETLEVWNSEERKWLAVPKH